MIDDLDKIIEGTRQRVAAMRRLTDETSRLLGETKKAEEDLAVPTQHIQKRHSEEEAAE